MKKLILFAALFLSVTMGYACTNLIVTKGATTDGSVLVSDVADSHNRYGVLDYKLAAKHKPGDMREVYQWGSDSRGPFRYCGSIKEAPYTYNVMSNMNEYQVTFGETTFNGSYKPLQDTTAILDYGSIMNICLQRSKTAREAILMFASLTDEYGYDSTGESFSVADPNEAWIMEVMPRKPKYDENGVNQNKGVVYVARRIPDGYICAHANCARITTFPLNDPENCLYSKDVISQAREMGWYEGPDEEFSFTDAYCPITSYSLLRACELRVWSFFNKYGDIDMREYLDYVTGEDPTHRMPLYVKAKCKISVQMLAEMMRDHYEGTPFDMREGLAAGPQACPYRFRDNDWTVDGVKYRNERPIAVQQAGFWFISQCRGWLPREVGGVIWFAVDDPGTAPLTPVYACSKAISDHYRFGNGTQTEYSATSMFWMTNRIAQFAYLNYRYVGNEVRDVIRKHEADMGEEIAKTDAVAVELLKKSEKKAVKYLTNFSVAQQDALFEKWDALDKYLLIKYVDGNIKKQNPDGSFEVFPHEYQGKSHFVHKSPKVPGMTDVWKAAVVNDKPGFFVEKKMTK